MMGAIIWIIFIASTVIVANMKNLNVLLFFALSVVLGPLALIAALVVPEEDKARKDREKSIPTTAGSLSLQEAQFQLHQLKQSLEVFQARIKALEDRMQGLPGEEIKSAGGVLTDKVRSLARESSAPRAIQSVAAAPQAVKVERNNLELDLGRYWLSKVGIIIFILGIGLLISYVQPFIWKYIGPVGKIVVGYAVSGCLFWMGIALEKKEKYVNFGRVLLGGAWALVYFTTYAMHHFAAVRIIQDQTTDLVLLFLVACAMIGHAMRYRSETMIMIALSVAFITTTVGDITMFTVISSLLLGVLVLFLVYRFQWFKVLGMSILTTYLLHYFWVRPSMAGPEQLTEFILLSGYAAIFLAGTHLIKADPKSDADRSAAAINLVNLALYGLSSYAFIHDYFFEQRFAIVLGIGVVYLVLALWAKHMKQQSLHISDTVAAVFAITLAVPLHFSDLSSSLIWLMEIPVLLLIGVRFQEKTYRYLSYALTVFMALWIPLHDIIFSGSHLVHLGNIVWTKEQFILFCAGLSMSVCFVIMHIMKKNFSRDAYEDSADQIFSAAAYACLMLWIFSWPSSSFITIWLTLSALAMLVLSLWVRLARFRVYMYFTLIVSACIFAVDRIHVSSEALQWAIIGFDAAVFFSTYYAVRWFSKEKLLEPLFEKEEWISFFAGIFVIAAAIVLYGSSQWLSLSCGITGGLMILAGMLSGDKLFRWSGFGFLGITVLNVLFVDLSHRHVIFRIISFIILGAVFLGISYLYNRYNIGDDKDKQPTSKS